MVTTKTIRNAGRRMLFAMLATAGSTACLAISATAQTGMHSPEMGMPMTDIPLAPGETIVSPPMMGGGGVIQHEGGSYQIVDSSSVPTMSQMMADPSLTTMPHSQAYSGYAGGSCANGNCGGGCASGNCGRSYGSNGYVGNACGPVCNPYIYSSFDALYVTNRNVDNYTRSPNFALDDFDYELGARVTMGMVPDCRNGVEASFTGPLEWDEQNDLSSPTGGIGTFLRPRSGVVAAQLSTFNNAIFQSQRYEADYFSFEASQTLIGWEICKLLYGLRYVNYDEEYLYRSVIASGQQGLLRSAVENKMVGGQVGMDMTFPMSCKVWSDMRARAGIYGNFAENRFELSNAGAAVVRNFDDDVEIAGLFELSSGLRYYLTDDFHVRAGGELWYLAGVATSIDQFDTRVRRSTGRTINIDDDVLMVGISIGAELKF